MTITQEALKELIARGEGESLEFKSSLSDMTRIVEVVASFANAGGGVVLIGVGSHGRILGLTIGDQTIERLANTITDNTDSVIYPEISTYNLDGQEIISIKVNESPDKPHLAFGRPFKRVGNVTKLMRRDEYERLLLQREKGKPQFGSQLCEGVPMEALDETYVMRYLQKRAESRAIEVPRIPLEQILANIGAAVWKKGRFIPTNAGVLFFGVEPQRFLPHSELKIARFKGTTMTEFIDRVELRGPLPELIDDAERFVRRNTRRATKIVDFEQVNIAEYPYEAIREAITNAVGHRDYFFTGASIRVMIFDERIEVESPGRLPEGVTLKNLEGSHVLRNERIAFSGLLFTAPVMRFWIWLSRGTELI
ncbi:MAG: putative DNA binding domain-containing protein [Candidatus Latescibacteria bacterium]|nr:putative DNA binding domain-containing protein [Candidatus Latescibacterota bacterium]